MNKSDSREADKRRVDNPMTARLIYLEPELWRVLDRIAQSKGKTRSTLIRIILKTYYKNLSKIEAINWNEN